MKSEELISKWDSFLKKGDIAGVRNSISSLYGIKVERHHRQTIASLLRRAGCYNTGLKVLHPALFYKNQTERLDVKNRDIAEYALLISEVGIPQQALDLFNRVDAEQIPMKNLYMAFCFFKMWNYEKAEEYLLKYLASDLLSQYDRLVGQINLLAALIENERLDKAEQLLNDLRPTILASEKNRAISNFLELEAQFFIKCDELDKASVLLKKAARLAQHNMERDGLYIRKWLAYLQAKSKSSLQALEDFSTEALNFHEWESVRDCEYLKLKVLFDPVRFAQLFVGTPKLAYRERLLKTFNVSQAPNVADLGDLSADRAIDVLQARYSNREILSLGRPLHQILYNLCSDFYAAQPVGALFYSTFPGEFYDPNSSPNRIHQLVFRLRNEFLQRQIDVRVNESNGAYRLHAGARTKLRMELLETPFSREAIAFKRLAGIDLQGSLRSKDVAEALSVSQPTAVRYIRFWISQGWLEKSGKGPETLYKVA